MFLKIYHYKKEEPDHSLSCSLYEGKHIELLWKNKLKQTPMRFVVDGVWIDIPIDRKKTIYIMNSEGKTIEKYDHIPTEELTPKQIKERDKLNKEIKKCEIH